MLIKALRMTLYLGQTDEYRRRHDAVWPELSDDGSGRHRCSVTG